MHACDMTHPYVTWHMCNITDFFAMTHSCVWHDSSIRDMTHMCNMTDFCAMTHSCVWHDSSLCDMTRPKCDMTHMCDMTHICAMTHMCDSMSRVCHVTYGWVMSHMDESCLIWMSHVTYGWVMSHALIFVPWLIRIYRRTSRSTTHRGLVCVWHYSSTRDTTHPHVIWHIHVTWLSRVWHDSFVCMDAHWAYMHGSGSVVSDVTHSCTTCLIHMCRDSFIHHVPHSCMPWLIHT